MGLVAWLCFSALLQCVLVVGKQTYVVHMNYYMKPSSYATHKDWYVASLESLPSSSSTNFSLLYIYDTVYHGFAASLNPEQVEALRRSNSVLGVYKDQIYTLHTTRTPDFLGLNHLKQTPIGKTLIQASQNVIIGVLDTGVWPESKSFDDSGMSPIPNTWGGKCETGSDFNSSCCNRKLIGARAFFKSYVEATGQTNISLTPRDQDGHGTHTSSTAAGSCVSNASLDGYATGTACGMGLKTRVAVYKVCWEQGCFSADILAGIERATKDGVHVLSMSLGGSPDPYYEDVIAVGAFRAMEKGILVSCSAGNSGPAEASVVNVAPWILTVGAGTLDRDFPAHATLGNGKRVAGASLYSGQGMGKTAASLVYANGKNKTSSGLCFPGSLEGNVVEGKVVVCDRGISGRANKGEVVRDAGGVGMILANTAEFGEELVADPHLLPAMATGQKASDLIRRYAESDENATCLLSFEGTVLDVRPAPAVAAFSSRGPNIVNPQILKPDLIAPGVNILAAWTQEAGPTGLDSDKRRTDFNIISGTSMSCPHISGLAAVVKAAHPEWSPSAIKSALMTTAYTLDNTNSPLLDLANNLTATPFDYGAGHVNIMKAISPGLIYNISTNDYITFLCSLNYNISVVKDIVMNPFVNCSEKYIDPGQLNYPSFSVMFNKNRTIQYSRVVTNVGPANSVYNVSVYGPPTVRVTVTPSVITFKNEGDESMYTVTFESMKDGNREERFAFGSITWSNEEYKATSQVAYSWA
ncbi:subtilisin-like protease SBT1.8 [Malania oleifera]|uniref:subtilisin-like protease SBT1.8 n=1 Tax=Malania oleifera TaxID=397392 RepID=UPI0025ADEAC7|nr:subtilisin-like protease SBT1.8 [Malania oleifera]